MRKLNRSLAQKPICLNSLVHITHDWNDVSVRNKKRIWQELDKFQNEKCVYCESTAYRGDNTTGHIEHFFDKSEYREKTFDWDNLFGCCASNTHCGHFKDQFLPGGDRRNYDSSLLIKPDIDNPEQYFQFLPNGIVKPKLGLDIESEKRAKETIRALNLNESSLEISREKQVSRFEHKVTTILKLLDSEDEETQASAWNEYHQLKNEAQDIAYQTAVKQAVSWLES